MVIRPRKISFHIKNKNIGTAINNSETTRIHPKVDEADRKYFWFRKFMPIHQLLHGQALPALGLSSMAPPIPPAIEPTAAPPLPPTMEAVA